MNRSPYDVWRVNKPNPVMRDHKTKIPRRTVSVARYRVLGAVLWVSLVLNFLFVLVIYGR